MAVPVPNDIDPRKEGAYAANWGTDERRFVDVALLGVDDSPGEADLA